ncbi:carbon-nitrogen hydrolase family protein [bacterium]|nr:carbon-nitrogen hydrolase family protein [bacterium]
MHAPRLPLPAVLAVLFTAALVRPGLAAPVPPDTPVATIKVLLSDDTFPVAAAVDTVAGWHAWSQREATRPLFFTAETPSLGGAGSLGLAGTANSGTHGGWIKNVPGIQPGHWYRFSGDYTCDLVPWPRQQVLARLDWRDAKGARTAQPEYVPEMTPSAKGWQRAGGLFKAPEGAASVNLELYLSYCPQGRAWWDNIRLEEVADPGKRMVRVATVNCFPQGTENGTASVEQFCKLVDEAGKKGCDIVCLGEGINMVGIKGDPKYDKIAEPIPGPTTNRLGELARKHHMYIVAALDELEGGTVYNTGVLIDRSGNVAGRYHKVMLPREEIEGGATPGNGYPVFDTDFGRIGIMICWDVQYVDPARALAVQGAEIVFLPIWDGVGTLIRARAIENQVYLVDCIYGGEPSRIFDPWGNVIAEAGDRPGIGVADIDLNAPQPDPWLGDMHLRFLRERRADITVPALER